MIFLPWLLILYEFYLPFLTHSFTHGFDVVVGGGGACMLLLLLLVEMVWFFVANDDIFFFWLVDSFDMRSLHDARRWCDVRLKCIGQACTQPKLSVKSMYLYVQRYTTL